MWGREYKYVKGQDAYVIEETHNEYKVYCFKNGSVSASRNRNIADRQMRMMAIDLMGSYIIFKSSEIDKNLGPDYFQVYVDGIKLHYNAYLEGVKQEMLSYKGQPSLCYSCRKTDYNISDASFQEVSNFSSLLETYYLQNKGEKAACLLYRFPDTGAKCYANLEQDFISGNTILPAEIRMLQSITDRFEYSVFGIGEDFTVPNKSVCPETAPYSHFFYEEMVTAVPLKEKAKAYSHWQSMIDPHYVYEEILLFCAKRCRNQLPSTDEVSLSSVIEAFPGAISPFAIRKPTNDNSYREGAAAYSKSDFASSAQILREAVDNEGISAPILNLLGASYRYLGHPEKALPYLLLCLKLDPQTPYLAGNIFLCLSQLQFKDREGMRAFLSSFINENWSKKVINN